MCRAQERGEAIEKSIKTQNHRSASPLVATMAEGVAAADEDLQPLYVPKFPKLKKLSLENRDVQATEYVQALIIDDDEC